MKIRNNIAAIYVRVSTLKTSQKDSPEHQKSLCIQKAMDAGLEVRPEYIYEDRSTGTSIVGREEIKQLLEDAGNGYFSTIIFASLSRFSRDSLDAISLKRKLVNGLGLRLISIEDIYDSGESDNEMIFTIISAVNQKLSEQISIASKRGIRESALQGNFTGSIAPYGYKKVLIDGKKTLEVMEYEASIVRKIYDLYVYNNMGEKSVVNYLNDEGIPSPKGGVWGLTTVQRILQNEAYKGLHAFGKYKVKKYQDMDDMHNRINKLVQVEKDSWHHSEKSNWEAIIDEELFDKAQEIRLMRGGGKRGGVRNVKVNPFSGIIKCAHCGKNFVSMKSGKKRMDGQKNEYRYLICSSRRRMGVKGCPNGYWIPLEKLTKALLHELKSSLSTLINVDEVSSNIKVENDSGILDNEKQIKQNQRLLDRNRKLLFELRNDFKLGEVDKEQFVFEKEQLDLKIKELQNRLKNLSEVNTQEVNEKVIKQKIKEALEKLVKLEFSEVDELQLVLKQIVEVINVNKEGEVEIRTPLGVLHP
ncbi:recombinase family protein [Bacillus sp. EB01]|uniref:recombinase family protein n=1 Tax=Bacillus sp. EB01 TaxID=1347086 RepID=UPI0005C5C048|nr:recombinase family protein [Bacillus sp. EB01]